MIGEDAPLGLLERIDRAESNECLERWGHRMGPLRRPLFRGALDYGLREKGELIAIATADTLIRPTAQLTRHDAFELSRLCAAAPRLTRLMLRLWTEIAYPEIVRTWGTPWAISYQNAAMHNGDLYRFDGWVRLRYSTGGRDPRSLLQTVTAQRRVLWGWNGSVSAMAARRAAEPMPPRWAATDGVQRDAVTA